jgi:hypothetical protein
MTTPQELLKKTTCYVNGQTKDGRVLAVASYIDRRMVCFLFEGKTYCDWIPEASLFENKIVIASRDQDKQKSKGESQEIANTPDISNKENTKQTDKYSTVKSLNIRNPRKEAKNDLQGVIDLLIKNPVKLLDQHVAATSRAIDELNREVNKIVKGSEETTIRLAEDTHKALVKSVSDTTESITKITADTHATVIRFVGDTCATTIQLTETTTAAIIRFPNDAYLTIYGQTEASTRTLVKIFEDVQNSINYGANLVIALTDAEIRARLNEIFLTVNAVIKPIFGFIANQWNRYWKERILTAIKKSFTDEDKNKKVNLSSARKIVDLLKKDFPDDSPRQIVDHLILEKSIFATVVSLINETPVGSFISEWVVNLLDMSELIIEMIYQIFYAYDLNEFVESDIFAINILCFSDPIIENLGLGLEVILDTTNKLPTWGVTPVANLMLLLIVGYTACEFCEMKSEKNNPLASEKQWKTLEAKVIDYTTEVSLKEKELEASLDKSLTQMSPA